MSCTARGRGGSCQNAVMRSHLPGRTSRLVIAGFAGALLLAGCGASGGDDIAEATTTTTADSTTTTAGDRSDDTTTSTEAGSSDGQIDREALDALMPEASDIGADYHSNSDVEEGYDEPDDTDNAVADACPGAAKFMDTAVDKTKAARLFETEDGRNVEVTLDPTPSANFDEGAFDDVIDAINACDTIELAQNGVEMKLDLAAERDDSYGDRGVVMQMHAVMTHASFPAPIELSFRVRSYIIGSVSVSTSVNDGLNEDTLEAVPGDFDFVDQLAADLEPKVADLVG